MDRRLNLALATIAVAVALLAPAGFAQAPPPPLPPPPTPIADGATATGDLFLAYATNSQGNLVAITGQGQDAVAAVAGSQAIPLDQAMNILAIHAAHRGQTAAFAEAARATMADAATAQGGATVAYVQTQSGPLVQVVTGAAANALDTANRAVGLATATADSAVHHGRFKFSPPPTGGSSTVQGQTVADPRVQVLGFRAGVVNVTASILDARGNAIPFNVGKLPAARLVVAPTDGSKAKVFVGTVTDETRLAAAFTLPYGTLANPLANSTAWQLTVEAPNVPDALALSSPYVTAPYNALANGGNAGVLMADRVGPTTLLVVTDRVPPVLRPVSNFTVEPLAPGSPYAFRVNASDDLGIASVVLNYALQDVAGHLASFSADLGLGEGRTYATELVVPNGTARLFYGVLATDVGGNEAFLSGSWDLPLPPSVERPAPIPNPIKPPTPRPTPVVVVPPPSGALPPVTVPAQGPVTADPTTPGAVAAATVAPASEASGTLNEMGIGIAVAGGLFGIPFLILFLARL
jgi:hypothetical protein